MPITFKQKCIRCKKNYVLTTARNRFPRCYDCDKKDLAKEVTDPKMKKMFDIPESFYEQSAFLRDIKINYMRFENLSERQVAAFKSVVEKMKAPKESSHQKEIPSLQPENLQNTPTQKTKKKTKKNSAALPSNHPVKNHPYP